jgi:hypothetical protein
MILRSCVRVLTLLNKLLQLASSLLESIYLQKITMYSTVSGSAAAPLDPGHKSLAVRKPSLEATTFQGYCFRIRHGLAGPLASWLSAWGGVLVAKVTVEILRGPPYNSRSHESVLVITRDVSFLI